MCSHLIPESDQNMFFHPVLLFAGPSGSIRLTMAGWELYSALPLTGSQVRILTVEPGEYGETLQTKLRLGYLLHPTGALLLEETCPVQYQALSYHWGPKGERTVGLQLLASVHWGVSISGLARLRHDWQPVNFWIDAICINQEYFEEKALQVPRM